MTEVTSTSTINFVLSKFETEATLATLATVYQQEPVEQIDASATAIFYVTKEEMRNVFQFRTDAEDILDASASDLQYYVDDVAFKAIGIKPSDAMLNVETLSENPIATSDKNGNEYVANKMLVAHDFLRHLAKDLFGTYVGVDLFNNEVPLLQNIRARCGDVEEGAIMTQINALVDSVSMNSTDAEIVGIAGDAGAKYMTDDNDTNANLCRELYNQMISADIARFRDLALISVSDPEDGLYSLPFVASDSVSFKVTLNPATGQHEFIRGESGEAVKSRSYEIKLVVVETEGEKLNTEADPLELSE